MKDDILELAKEIANEAHKGQERLEGRPYIMHPMAVAAILKENGYDNAYQTIAYLHDVIEDSDLTSVDLVEKGIPKDIADVVSKLSRKKIETYMDYILRVASHPICRIVKLADLKHNMSDLKEGSRKDKYRLAKYILEDARISQMMGKDHWGTFKTGVLIEESLLDVLGVTSHKTAPETLFMRVVPSGGGEMMVLKFNKYSFDEQFWKHFLGFDD